MTNVALLSKLATLPADLQAEVADFIDFLVQKTAKGNSTTNFVQEVPSPLKADEAPRPSLERGSGKHLIPYIADDFDAPLEDFKDCM